MKLSCILIAVVVTGLYAFAKIHKTAYQKEWILLYVNQII